VTTSLRERKKQRSREALAAAALELFGEFGYDAVTVDQIVDRVGVSPRTFYRYFGCKEAVLFAPSDERVVALREAIGARPADEAPLAAMRAALLQVSEQNAHNNESDLQRARLARSGAATETYKRAVLQPQWEQAIAEALAERMAVDLDRDLRPRLLAGIAVAAMTAAAAVWLDDNGALDGFELLAIAFDALEISVLEALGG
jgi:AcrR family transcriptional regulator